MISAVNPALAVTKVAAPKKVSKPETMNLNRNKEVNKKSVDENQNDNLILELNYIGSQLKALLDIQAGKNVKVAKFSNELPEDKNKTTAQKQKDDAIVELGYIGDVLKTMVDVKSGKTEEVKPKKNH